MSTEEVCYSTFLKFPFSDRHNGVDKSFLGDSQVDAVDLEKHKGCRRAGSLVAVHERMVPNDVEQVGSCHLIEVGMKVLVACSSLRHSESRLEKSEVSNSFRAAVS